MRNIHDQIFKVVTESDPRALLDMIEALPLGAAASVTPLERELTRSPVYIDSAFLVEESGNRRIEHIEAFAQFQRQDVVRVSRYGNELGLKFLLPVFSTILLMVEAYDPGPVPTEGTFVLGALTVTLRFRVIRLWELEARRLLDTGRHALLQWIPLTHCRVEDWPDTTRAVARTGDPQLASNFHMMGALRYGKDEWHRLLDRGAFMIRDEVFEQTWLGQEWVRKGLEKGMAQGMAQGMEKGMEKGLEQGLQQGLENGRRMELRTVITELLNLRFSALGDQTAMLENVQDIQVLHSLFSALLKAPDEATAREILSKCEHGR